MTAERDNMIGISMSKIQTWVKENPNRGRTVAPIEIRVCSDTQEGENEVGPASTGGWVPTPLEPPGPVSLWLWKTDPEFRAATAQVRRTARREMAAQEGGGAAGCAADGGCISSYGDFRAGQGAGSPFWLSEGGRGRGWKEGAFLSSGSSDLVDGAACMGGDYWGAGGAASSWRGGNRSRPCALATGEGG
jgi:hypothetical protein